MIDYVIFGELIMKKGNKISDLGFVLFFLFFMSLSALIISINSVYENYEIDEELIEEYKQSWVSTFVSTPTLTEDEYLITLSLYEDYETYGWNRGYDFNAKIIEQSLYNKSINNNEFIISDDNTEFVCSNKSSGTAISAFANENHPLYKDDDYGYAVSVDYTCTQNEEDYLWLFGPIFYQDNQWWGFVFYEEDFYENYKHKNPELEVYAFQAKFVKRISLGNIKVNN